MSLGRWLYCYLKKKYGALDLGVDVGVIDLGHFRGSTKCCRSLD